MGTEGTVLPPVAPVDLPGRAAVSEGEHARG